MLTASAILKQHDLIFLCLASANFLTLIKLFEGYDVDIVAGPATNAILQSSTAMIAASGTVTAAALWYNWGNLLSHRGM